MATRYEMRSKRVRSVFVSDVHLGCRHSQGEAFLTYLRQTRADNIYLVGDFLDGWKLGRRFRWSATCDAIVNCLARRAAAGSRLFYTPGNHDAFLRRGPVSVLLGRMVGGIRVENELVHRAADGREFLVTHGDLCDSVERGAQWLSRVSSLAYDPLLSLNRGVSKLLRRDNRSPYAACAFVKGQVKRVVRFLSGYESRLLQLARDRNCDGVICGHVHTPAIVQTDDLLYCNTGDWVENCTAIEEDWDGSLSLYYFYPRVAPSQPERDATPETQPIAASTWTVTEPEMACF